MKNPMSSNLENAVVVITGASTGIGLETARLFGKAGAKIALIARRVDKLEAAEKEIRETGATVQSYPADVTQEDAVGETFAKIERELGPVDVLVNNAGVGFATNLATCSMADYRRIMETNVTGVFLCARAVLPSMKQRRRGHIINVSSITGHEVNPVAPLYCASKHAVNGYTFGLQKQVEGENVRVTLIAPTSVDTAYWDGRNADRGKFLQPGEVAASIFFAASQPEGVLIRNIDLTALR